MHRVSPAVSVVLVVVPVTEARLQLMPQEAHSHLQDVSFLQFGVGLLLVELLLQNDFELLDAAVDAISAHLFHNGFPQLRKIRQTCKFTAQTGNLHKLTHETHSKSSRYSL